MIFPETLVVIAIDSQTGSPVPEIALSLRLEAKRKNDYWVGPKITDANGKAEFTRTACEKEISTAQRMFLMDYYGDLSSCGPHGHIHLLKEENLIRMIQQYEQTPEFWGIGFDEPETLFAALRRVKNRNFEATDVTVRSSEILKKPAVTINLRRKPES